jgi:3-hydroxypropanoate dehydrogenase
MSDTVTPEARVAAAPVSRLDDVALDRLFRAARSTHAFSDRPVTDATLRHLYDLLKWGPTAFNAQPGRYVFVRSPAAKARLGDALSSGNKAKTLAAPVTCIVRGNGALAEATAFRNSSLQGAYLLLAARSLGLAAGPMSGFDPARIDAEFFADSTWTVNFLVNLGYPDSSEPRPRAPRFTFEECVQIA